METIKNIAIVLLILVVLPVLIPLAMIGAAIVGKD